MKKILACGAALALTQFASGEVLITFSNAGPDVTATLSGGLNTESVIIKDGELGGGFSGFNASDGALSMNGDLNQFWDTDVDWTAFGDGDFFDWDTPSDGTPFNMFFPGMDLGLPVDYISNDPLSGTATKLNASFKSLGLIPGTYVTTLTGPTGITDTVTVEVVPAPGALTLLGLAGLGAVRRRR